MKFRKFMLDDYLNGEEGQKCWEFFFNFRKHFEEGFIGLVVTAVLMWMTICVNFVILMQVGDAERWKPENGFEDKSEVIEMTEPLNTNGSLNKNSDSEKISEDSLQN